MNTADRKLLKAIIKKIEANTTDLWQHSLADTVMVVALEDVVDNAGHAYDTKDDEEENVIDYNGWLTDLKRLARG